MNEHKYFFHFDEYELNMNKHKYRIYAAVQAATLSKLFAKFGLKLDL